MKKKDKGAVHKFFAMTVLAWAVICWGVLLEVMRAGYVNRYLEDCLTQANLAAILIDPYHYGSTGELVFEDAESTKAIFLDFLERGLGSEVSRQKLGITKDVEVLDFRIYEVISDSVMELSFDSDNHCMQKWFDKETEVVAPDGTMIQNSSVYAKIAVPIEFLFGVEITAIKEHCVDIVSEEKIYE